MDLGKETPPRLAPRNAQVEIADDRHRPAGEENISISPFSEKPIMAGGVVHLKQAGQLMALVDPLASGHPAIDLLKGDQVGLPLLDDVADPLEIDPPVSAPAVMNVISHHGQWTRRGREDGLFRALFRSR